MHKSVLLEESIASLNLKEDSIIVDCTLGYAGHSSHILKRIKKGFLFAFDQDEEAIQHSMQRLASIGTHYEIIHHNFVDLKTELQKRDIYKVDGILFDLGVSSPQLDEDYRGFSFHKDAPLDMRMDQRNPKTAKMVVNTYPKSKLISLLKEYGEEKYAGSIVSAIVKEREKKEIETTLELASIIQSSVPFSYKKDHHPARKTFQAIRIEVNDELANFQKALVDAIHMLHLHGRVCVITFHSLEDRICKQIFKEYTSVPKAFQSLPIVPKEYEPKYKIIGNIVPSKKELEENNRARSARLRIIEKIKE